MPAAHVAQLRQLADGDGLAVVALDVLNGRLDALGRGALPLGGALGGASSQAGEHLQQLGTHPQLVGGGPPLQQVHHLLEGPHHLAARRGGAVRHPGQEQLALHHRGHVPPPDNVVFVAAQKLRAEHHRGEVQLRAVDGLGGVELPAVEEHQVPGLGLKVLRAALHLHGAPLHLEQLHLAVPVAFQLPQVGGIGRLHAVAADRQADVPVVPLLPQLLVDHASPPPFSKNVRILELIVRFQQAFWGRTH